MIIILKRDPNPEQMQSPILWLQEKGISIHTGIKAGNTQIGGGNLTLMAGRLLRLKEFVRTVEG